MPGGAVAGRQACSELALAGAVRGDRLPHVVSGVDLLVVLEHVLGQLQRLWQLGVQLRELRVLPLAR